MKGKKIIASVFLMALCAGCGNSHQEKETGIITVDVHADYYLDPGKRDRNDRFYTGGNYWRTLNSFVLDTTSGFA